MNKRQAYSGLLLILLITLALGSQIRFLKFNDNFDSFFPEGDTDLEYYLGITEEFGVYNNFLLLSIQDEDPLGSNFLQRIDELTQKLEKEKAIEAVISPTNYKRFQVTPLSVNSFNVFPPNRDIEWKDIENNERVYGQFFGKDDKSLGLILRHIEFGDKKLADAFYEELQNELENSGFNDYIISGKVQAQYDFSIRLKNELATLLGIAVLVVITMLVIVFGSFRGVIIPLLALLITLIWMMGFFGLMRHPVDILSIMIPPILLVVSMSDVIHLCNKFNDLLKTEQGVSSALKHSIKHVGLATLLTSLTTAVGFFSLIVSPVSPIKNFGIYTGVGVVIAFVVIFITVPCLLTILGKSLHGKKRSQTDWSTRLNMVFSWIIKRKSGITLTSFALLVLGILATLWVKKNTYIFVGVDKNDPLTATVQYFDKYYDGSRPFEMTFTLPSESSLFTSETLEALDQTENYLKATYGVSHIESPLAIIKTINQALNGGSNRAYILPKAEDLARIKRFYYSGKFEDFRNRVQSENGITMRINGRMQDIGSAEARKRNQAFETFMAQNIDNNSYHYRLTGTSYLIDKTDDYIVTSIIKGLLIAIVIVAGLMLLIARSWYIMLVAVFVNVLPLIMLSGIMGLLHVDLNIATAVIFSIAFGIAVDDSIHFITCYKLERKTHDHREAIQRTFISAGKSILLTTLVLSVGFMVFLCSGFSTTFYIGLFSAITFALAVAADMILLPALLAWKKK